MNSKKKKKRKHSLMYSLTYDDSPLDERQKALSTKISIESLAILSSLIITNIFVMERFYKWCETILDSTFIICGVCLIYFVLRNGITGCLFGIKGVGRGMTSAAVMMFFNALLSIKNTFDLARLDDKPFMITHNGMLTHEFSSLLYWGLYIIYVLLFMIFVIREKRAKKRRAESSDKEELK